MTLTRTDAVIDVHLTPDHAARALRADARTGLLADPKWLPPKWFYDARGSRLFEQITRLPEYYPTRAEREILDTRAGEIAALTDAHTLVELGSGSSEKTRLLLDALREHGTLRQFVPLDVSESALREAAAALAEDYLGMSVHGVVGDFTEHLSQLPGEAPRIVAFLGGTIGNLLPAERAKFFRSVHDVLDRGEWLLLGTDLVKDPDTLVRAYDDEAGVTAEFNKNVLRVLNRQLGADFDVDSVRARRALGRVERVDRDAPARHPGDERAAAGDRARCRVRRGRGAEHRDLGEVPPRGRRGRAGRHRVRAGRLVDRLPEPLRALPLPRRRLIHPHPPAQLAW